jgi:ABC-type molybdate transport system substrate-binding protein
MIDTILKRREFACAQFGPSSRGEGDMKIQFVQEILNKPEIDLVAHFPLELGGHMDSVRAVSSRSTHSKKAPDLIKFLTRQEAKAAWAAKGMRPF